MRRRHLLRKISAEKLWREFIFFDCETTPEPLSLTETRLKFRLAVGVHVTYRAKPKPKSESWAKFTTTRDLWEWIVSKSHERTALYVVAHNAEFDFRVSKGFTTLVALGWEIKRFFLDGNKFTVWWQKGSRSLIILDSMQLLPSSLAALGDMLELPKGKMPAFDLTDDEWFDYCRRDVEVLALAMDRYRTFVDVNNLGGMAKTTAGQAFRAFRYRYMTEAIEIHDDPDALKLERAGYYGGRTECFFIGNLTGREYFILDVSSMYPSVMKDSLYPVQLIAYAEGTPLYRLRQLQDRYYLIADVDIVTDVPVYPMRYRKHLAFPVGRFRTILQGPELAHALSARAVKRCHRSAVYYKTDIFSAYVTDLYGMRRRYQEEGNEPFTYLTKRLLNSLYGKFGQRGFVYEEIGVCDPEDCWQREMIINGEPDTVTEFAFGGKVYIRRRAEEAQESFPAISGAVTAYGRMLLWGLMEQAGRENVYYIDTDSLLVNGDGLEKLKPSIKQGELGALHLDRIAEKVIIYGLKDYAIEGRRTVKGVKMNAIRTGEHSWVEQKWERFHSALHHGRLEDYRIRLSPKVLKLPYEKGVVLPSGVVVPHRL